MHSRFTLAFTGALSLGFWIQNCAADTELAPVVVTATRTALPAQDALSSVTIITHQDIVQLQAQSLPDLLDGLAGMEFANNGGPGKTSSLYMRGTSSGHTLILIDGVRVGSATDGTTALQDIPLAQIDHIEVVRGPRASLYGSDAIGGVIQIFTRRGVHAPVFTFGGGSHSTFETSASGGFGSANAWLDLGASGYTTHGINADASGEEGDSDGYRRYASSIKGGGRIGGDADFDLELRHTAGTNEYDGDPNLTEFRQDLYAGNIRYALTDDLSTRLRLAQSVDASKNYRDAAHDPDFSSRFDTRRNQVSWQNDWTVAEGHTLTGGVDYLNDTVTSSTDYAQTSRDDRALFGQYVGRINRFDLQLAARHDLNEQYGSHNTGSLGVGYALDKDLHLYANHGTAFKAPTFNDLYYPDAGNASLKPEQSHSSEIGISGKTRQYDWQASAYRTRITNMIAWAPTSDPYVWLPGNIDKARISGLELSGHYTFGKNRMGAAASFLSPRNASGDENDGKLLPRRARHTMRFDFDHPFGSWNAGSTLRAVGRRYDNADNTTKLGGYAIVDLRVAYTVTPEWEIQTRLENVLDKRYETASGYNQPGIGAYVTLRYQPRL